MAWQPGCSAVAPETQPTSQTGGPGHPDVSSPLPIESPWLNPLEAHGVQGKRIVVEPARLLTAAELVERVNIHCGCPCEEPLSNPQRFPDNPLGYIDFLLGWGDATEP